MFDTAYKELLPLGRVLELHLDNDDPEAYHLANESIVDLALRKSDGRASAAIVWDGISRGTDDITAAFERSAKNRGMDVFEISTLL
jgi:hypothetical protein